MENFVKLGVGLRVKEVIVRNLEIHVVEWRVFGLIVGNFAVD